MTEVSHDSVEAAAGVYPVASKTVASPPPPGSAVVVTPARGCKCGAPGELSIYVYPRWPPILVCADCWPARRALLQWLGFAVIVESEDVDGL